MEEIAAITQDFNNKLMQFKRDLSSLSPTIKGKRKVILQIKLITPVLSRLPRDIMSVNREVQVQHAVEEADRMEAATPEIERQNAAAAEFAAQSAHDAALQGIGDERRGEVVLPFRFGGRRRTRRSVYRRRRTSRR